MTTAKVTQISFFSAVSLSMHPHCWFPLSFEANWNQINCGNCIQTRREREFWHWCMCIIHYSVVEKCDAKFIYACCTAGGTFALYSLICRHAKLRTIPNQDQSDEELTTYSCSIHQEQSFAARSKRWLENHGSSKTGLIALVLIGSSMVIGDGILTPAISGSFFADRHILRAFIIKWVNA